MPTPPLKLESEFDKIWTLIEKRSPLALTRYGDGERALMCGKAVKAQEGWEAPPRLTGLGEALSATLEHREPNFYYGIACPCCNREVYYWYASRLESKNLTFANLFVNANYQKFFSRFSRLKGEAVVIANRAARGKPLGRLKITDFFAVDDDCVGFYQSGFRDLMEGLNQAAGEGEGKLFVVSAGPLSEVIIHRLYQLNPRHTYVDFGSCLDMLLHGRATRPYMDPRSDYARQKCLLPDPQSADLSVTAVLNLYKRPENLPLQLERLSRQSLKPREIIVFQDGRGKGDSQVRLPGEFASRVKFFQAFDNIGVWGRFAAGLLAQSRYVCLFDDDIFPGERWLENCYASMLKRRGLYGGIGIVLEDTQSYPYNRFFRLGWDNPVEEITEVDFVGHSWFLETGLLAYLFAGGEEFRRFKYVAEDMFLSYSLRKHTGLPTLVPPHPRGEPELFSSDPALAREKGGSREAVSLDPENLELMNRAFKMLISRGWKPVKKRNLPLYMLIRAAFNRSAAETDSGV